MANILYLVHRLPYPPNQRDKLRSYNLLKHLLKSHRVFLGTFTDDSDDEPHIAMLRGMCADIHVARLDPRIAKIRSLNGLLAGDPMTLRYYRDAALQNWVDTTCHQQKIDAAVSVGSSMAQYIAEKQRMPVLIDFVDVDSVKWTQCASEQRWPMSWLSRREGELLLAYEREIAKLAARSFFATEAEVALFGRLAPECSIRVEVMGNGVDTDYFSPDPLRPTPFTQEEIPIVFAGTMDCRPNVDAAIWFTHEVLPGLRQRLPQARFHIVGRCPAPEILALISEHVVVTGTVADIRPYLQHAGAVVAPVRAASGFQNTVLEAMAMGCPVVAAAECIVAVDAAKTNKLVTATSAGDFIEAIVTQVANPDAASAIGQAARSYVIANYNWTTRVRGIDPYLASPSARQTT